MKTFPIPFGSQELSLQLDEKNFYYYAAPVHAETIPDQAALLKAALDQPIGAPRLEDSVKPGMKIVVIVDDVTRPTPKKYILPEVLRRLSSAGISKSQVKIVIGLGTHRKMHADEIDQLIGSQTIAGYELVHIDYKEQQRFVNLGRSENGTPIEVYREVVEADFKIAIGNIVPHIVAGWGGGAKIIQPAVCSEATTEVTHLMACLQQNVLEVCGNPDNLVRREMEKIAGQVGLDFIINTVLNEHKQMLGVFAGHYVQAHRAGVKLAEQVMRPAIPGLADILVASANPACIDFWQGIKPYIFAQYGVREGGVIIFAIDASEGLSGNAPQHGPTLSQYLLYSFEEQKALIDKGGLADLVGMNVTLFHALVRQRTTTICISNGLSRADKDKMGFLHADTLDEALQMAYGLTSPAARVGIIPYAGETLVRSLAAS